MMTRTNGRAQVKRARTVGWVLCLISAGVGCAGGPSSEAASHSSRRLDVIGGVPSTDEQNSVVLLVREQFKARATGVVVAPNLIMTARHFLYEVQFGENQFLVCPEQGGTTPVLSARNPVLFEVIAGRARPDLPVVARGVNIHSGNDLDVCANDIAFLEVDVPLPVPPLPMRLDQPPSVGEEGVLIGWGATSEDLQTAAFEHLTDARQQRDITVLAIGPTSYTPPESTIRALEGAIFLGTEGGCMGDSGAPLLSKVSGAIIGIEEGTMSRDPVVGLDEDDATTQCFGAFTRFQRLDVQKEWIRSTFRSVGAAPWLEGGQQPAPFGGYCDSEDDCLSGICITAGRTAFCSAPCANNPCPEGSECVGAGADRVCSIRDVAGSPIDGGCGLMPTAPGPWVLAWQALLSIAASCVCRRLVTPRPSGRA
jgi:hypothetical protein